MDGGCKSVIAWHGVEEQRFLNYDGPRFPFPLGRVMRTCCVMFPHFSWPPINTVRKFKNPSRREIVLLDISPLLLAHRTAGPIRRWLTRWTAQRLQQQQQKKSRSNYPDRIISGIGYYYHCSDSCCCRCLVFYSNIIFRGWSFRRLALSGHSFFLSTADDDQPLNDKGHTFRFCPLRGAYDDDDGRQGRRNQEIRAKEIYM